MEDVAIKAALKRWERVKQDIDLLRNKIAGDQAQLARLQAEAADLDEWIAKWHEFVGRPIPATAAERIVIANEIGKPRRPKNPDREVVAEQSVEIIHAHGAPMSRKELFEALKARGTVVRGKDPEMVLSTMLWRSKDKIERTALGYWPVGTPCPPIQEIQDSIEI